MCLYQAHNDNNNYYNYNSKPQGISANNATKPTVGSTTTKQWPLLALLSTQLMRLSPITNYMRPCHDGLNTIDTNVFPCILFTQQSNILRKSNKPKPTTIVVFTFNHKPAANTSGHTHNRSSQHALTPIWMPAMLYNWLVFKTQQPTNSKQSNKNVLLSIHRFFSKTGGRNLFTDQIVRSTPHIWAYTNATQPSLEPVFSHP